MITVTVDPASYVPLSVDQMSAVVAVHHHLVHVRGHYLSVVVAVVVVLTGSHHQLGVPRRSYGDHNGDDNDDGDGDGKDDRCTGDGDGHLGCRCDRSLPLTHAPADGVGGVGVAAEVDDDVDSVD